MKEIILAGGCFWGVEAYYQKLKGIHETEVGYANGKIDNPSYQDVKKGDTDFAEIVKIQYDEQVITLEKIFEHLFRFIDPTSLNKQGEDEGTQYRTGIYYQNEEDKEKALQYIASRQVEFQEPIVVEVKQLMNFYTAEEYHQKYLDKNPSGYCHVNFGLIKPEEMK
jgi:peptide-methionine (S)-S-oxide reductase